MEEDGGKTGPSCRRVCVSLLSLLSVAVPFSKFSYTVSWKRLYNALSNKCNNKKIISGCLRFVFCQLSRKISWSLPPRPCRCFRPLPGGVHESGLFWYMYIYLFCLAAQHTRSLPAHFAHGGGDSRITKNNRSRMCVKSFGLSFCKSALAPGSSSIWRVLSVCLCRCVVAVYVCGGAYKFSCFFPSLIISVILHHHSFFFFFLL